MEPMQSHAPTLARLTCHRCGFTHAGSDSGGLCPRCLWTSSLFRDDPDPLIAVAWADASPATSLTARTATPHLLAGYELIEEIARGGMGVVYKARQTALNRIVAMKVLAGGVFASLEFARRFRAEAATVARLRHPNIVTIHETGEADGLAFFTMDFVDGPNLAERARSEPFLPREAAACIETVARGVAFAHSQGVLHRDLKPSNILLDLFGQPQITDFGLAKQLEAVSHPSTNDLQLTATGQSLGSPGYAAPEQIRAAVTDARSDVYGLGATLYHLLTGRAPFAAATALDTLRAAQDEEALPPRRLNPSIPRDLETICLRCLEKEPTKRYATAQELADELNRFLRDEPIHARPVSRAEHILRWCRRKPALSGALVAAAMFLIAGLAGVLWQWREAKHHARLAEINASTAHEAATRAEASALAARRAQYGSDMNLAHQAVQEGDFKRARQLLERHRGGSQKKEDRSQESGVRSEGQLLTAHFQLPAPDSRLLAPDLRSWEWHYLWERCRGEELFTLGSHSNGVWTVGVMPDGITAFSGGGDGNIRFWNLQSGEPAGILPHPRRVNFAIPTPEGALMITGTEDLSGGGQHQPIRIWDLATRQVVSLLHTNSWFKKSVAMSADGRWFAFADTFAGIFIWDLPSRRHIATLPTDIPYFGPLGVAISPDNRTLAYNDSPRGDIVLWDVLEQREMGRLVGHVRFVRALTFSPDGKLLASASQEGVIKVWEMEHHRERWSIEGGLSSDAFRFSPDGTLLAAGTTSIQLYDVGSGRLRGTLQGHQGGIRSLAFTLDGQRLICGSTDGTVRVWDVASAFTDRTSIRLPENIREGVPWDTHGPAVFLSPDGLHLLTVYANDTFGFWDALERRELFRAPLPMSDASVAAIRPGGDQVAFGSVSGELRLWETASRTPRQFARPEHSRINKLTFSPDGKRLAMGAGSSIRVFDLASRAPIHAFAVTNEFVMSIEFSVDGAHLMAGFFSGLVKLWRLEGTSMERTFRGHEAQVRALGLVDGGRTLISSGNEVKRWDVETGRELPGFLVEGGAQYESRVSPDRRRILFGSGGGVSVWDLETLQPVLRLKGPVEIPRLAFTPDGNHLIWADRTQLRVLSATTRPTPDAASYPKGTTP